MWTDSREPMATGGPAAKPRPLGRGETANHLIAERREGSDGE
jgi:hypothetical protein